MPKEINKLLLGFMAVIITLLCIPIAIDLRNPLNASAATDYLENLNYVVFTPAEWALVAKEATAAAAVDAAEDAVDNAETAATNAAAAVVEAQAAAAKVDLFNCAEVFLFPSVTNVTITLIAGNTNVWSAWAEVVDSTAVTLSSKFAAQAGYINDMYIYDHSAVDKIYCIELAYGAAKTTLGRIMWHTSFKDAVQIKSRRVPAGETIYYRMMCSGANGANAKIGFRYFYE